jgi:hypothetical protein
MDCTSCGSSGSNYSSISTPQCVSLCGAGISTTVTNVISTYVTNPFFSVSSLNISTLFVTVVIPSAISTFVSISDISVHISGPISTVIMNSNLSVSVTNFPLSFSTFVTNRNLSVNVANFPLSFSTFVTNSNLSVNVANFPSFYSTAITNFPLSFSTFVTNSNLSVNVANFPSFYSTAITNFPLSFSTFVTNSNLSVNVANFPSFFSTAITNFPLSFSTFVTNSNLSVNVANFPSFYSTAITNFPLSFSTFVTNSNLSVNVANFPLSFSTFVTNPSITVTIPSTLSTFIVNPSLTVTIPSTLSTTITGGSVSIVGAVSTNAINATLDVFHQLLVDTPTTTFANHHAFTDTDDFVGYVSSGTGTVFVDISNTLVQMTVSGSGGRAVEQSREYQLYQPGKGHVVILTLSPQYSGTFDNSVAIRAGIYDDYRDKNTPAGTTGAPPYLFQSSINGGTGQECNQPSMGHFFELSGNQWFVVERYNSPNNITNVDRVAQSNWNVDPMNGSGPSGYTLAASNPTVLFFIERQWLGVGIVRMGLYYNATPYYCHVFQARTIRRPYTHLNKLPIRWEIEKVPGGSSNAASMAAICASGQIGGNYIPLGAIFSIPANLLSATVRVGINELRPILLVRLQQKYCRATFKLIDTEFYGTAAGFYSILRNPAVSGTITWIKHPDPSSLIEYAYFPDGSTSTRTVTGGLCIRSGFYSARAALQDGIATSELITRTQFSSDIKGNPDILCLAMGAFTANTDVNANMRWIEIV